MTGILVDDINRDVVVGDLTSNAPGSGARKNGGKVDYSLLPLLLISESVSIDDCDRNVYDCLQDLFHWQRDGGAGHLRGALESAVDPARTLLESFADCARVLECGKAKYAAWNWAKGMPWSVPFACAIRHLLAIAKGEETDPESGCSHWGHVQANILMLLLFRRRYPELNDMPFAVLKAPCGI